MKKILKKLKNNEHVTIVAIGDSNTELTFHTRGHMNWVNLLSEAIFENYGNGICTMINSGRCSDGSVNGLERLERDVLRFDPDLVIIAFGMGDAYAGIEGIDDFKARMREMIKIIRDKCSSEILLRTSNPVVTAPGVPLPQEQLIPGKEWNTKSHPLDKYAKATVELADELQCSVVDHYILWTEKQFFVKYPVANPCSLWPRMGDAIHPGHIGHLIFYRELAPLFQLPTYFPWEEVDC